MAIKRRSATTDVLTAARQRLVNIFNNGLPIYMSFSAGKDSLVLAHLVLGLVQDGKINAEQLIVQFIDEEAIYPCIENTAKKWRKKFMLVGAKFEWYCVEVRHYNCFNSLENDESYICWDSTRQADWIRQPPSFAIRYHPRLRPRRDTYQDFLPRITRDGLAITGVRMAESLQRLQYFAYLKSHGYDLTKRGQLFPIYDWKDADVWRYIYENNIDIPEVYLYLWQTGHNKHQLRISQFFSIDTARSLVKMNEYYPDLMERIIKREPNAYIAALYWDTEMFGRRSKARQELEKLSTSDNANQKDHKAELLKMFSNMPLFFTTQAKLKVAQKYRKLFINISSFATERDYKDLYEALIKGDPKLRSYRGVYQNIYTRYIAKTKTEYGEGRVRGG